MIILLLFFIAAQSEGQFANVRSTTELAQKISDRYGNDAAKIEAAYSWVTTNIRYSTKDYFAINNSINHRDIIDIAFRDRKGVCANFSAIFADICSNMGIEAHVIQGYKSPTADVAQDGHSWVVVKMEQDWYLFDPTWDIGKQSGFAYYKKTGSDFIKTHMPFDPMWQLLDYPIIEHRKSKQYFNFKDSIQVYLASDSMQQIEMAIDRVNKKGAKNKLTSDQVKVLKLQLEIKREEEQMEWYESAVALINNANKQLNKLIDLGNQQFRTVKNPEEPYRLLGEIQSGLDSATIYLDSVDQSKATLVYGTWQAREKSNG